MGPQYPNCDLQCCANKNIFIVIYYAIIYLYFKKFKANIINAKNEDKKIKYKIKNYLCSIKKKDYWSKWIIAHRVVEELMEARKLSFELMVRKVVGFRVVVAAKKIGFLVVVKKVYFARKVS
jgi:hypothetical protein